MALTSVAFSPDGAVLALGARSGAVHRYRVTGERPTRLTDLAGPHSQINGVAFSLAERADGSLLAVAGRSGLALRRLAPDGTPSTLVSVLVEPLHRGVVVGAQDGLVTHLTVDPARARVRLCALPGATVTAQQWRERVPGIPFRPPCTTG